MKFITLSVFLIHSRFMHLSWIVCISLLVPKNRFMFQSLSNHIILLCPLKMHFLCFECIVFILFFAISVFFGVSFFDRQDISLFEVACFKMLLVALGIMERQLFFSIFSCINSLFSVRNERIISLYSACIREFWSFGKRCPWS